MLDEIESKLCEEGNRWWKRSKTLSEVKPVENISKESAEFSRDKSLEKGSPFFT